MSTKPQHLPIGDPCTTCGLPSRFHRIRGVRNREYDRQYNHDHPRCNPSERVIGIDGEGQGAYPHLYNYLAAADENGEVWDVRPAGDRLTTVECLDFILDLPRRALIFGYAFVYDITKILTDLPNKLLHLLFHERRRARMHRRANGQWRVSYAPVKWRRFSINYMNRRLTISCGSRRATVWDIFRFFSSKFTQALTDWKVADKAHLVRMAEMKEKRKTFDQLSPSVVEEYCQEECRYLAKLGRQLLDAHEEAELPLAGQYYGAGSTASALLKRMDVRRYAGEFPAAMRKPLASAFFGGRFENSIVGPVKGPVYNYDISSAYPYQATFLPCLNCGKWSLVPKGKSLERLINVSALALIKWSIATIQPAAWGVFPVRDKDGTIRFPLSGEGGWTWKQEFLAGRKFNSHVEADEAWVYDTDCDHQPFRLLPEIYRERVRWGKDAKGIVLKLGPNSVYGKVAQSRGINPPFQNWIWAGNITSGCRAQLLDSLVCVRDPWNVLMFATDGVWSREKLSLPAPMDNGTGDLEKPLGGWEEKTFDRGVFAVRPGIYFPLQPSENEIKEVRARGLGKRVLYEKWHSVVDAYQAGKTEVVIAGAERFIGAKSGIGWVGKSTYRRSQHYGEWISQPISVGFHPQPKRKAVLADGRLQPWSRLKMSVPYKNAMMSPEAAALKLAQEIAEEQADADFSYEDFAEVTT